MDSLAPNSVSLEGAVPATAPAAVPATPSATEPNPSSNDEADLIPFPEEANGIEMDCTVSTASRTFFKIFPGGHRVKTVVTKMRTYPANEDGYPIKFRTVTTNTRYTFTERIANDAPDAAAVNANDPGQPRRRKYPRRIVKTNPPTTAATTIVLRPRSPYVKRMWAAFERIKKRRAAAARMAGSSPSNPIIVD